ncbi:GAF domain-containing sensor histidine kinase [Adhaeribacter radiodurans]|uniref:histidine kinase n=1 Tax=Adhaeribacter radiodurans TaxID=2745197 RepID=A0A7L7LCN9_9BACT|nr:ATP-binding protein [Adhaeribacter radiodurans]QMU30612.1 GAF domain-containing protein [Adhaeribacter radiodurans]
MQSKFPVPLNESERIKNLAGFDLDYINLEDKFSDFTYLASQVAGTPISLINLIDPLVQWSIARQGLPLKQLPREDSVCQYTITQPDYLEINDLTADERFLNKSLLTNYPDLRYYLGVPLKTQEGYNVGSLCVLDTKVNALAPEKIELLQIIAAEIVNRLQAMRTINTLQHQLTEANQLPKKLVHDVQGPIRAIQALCQVVLDEGYQNSVATTLEALGMIQKSSQSLIELAEEILTSSRKADATPEWQITLVQLKEKLEKLHRLQAQNKNVSFQVNLNPAVSHIPFSKNKLLQILGNLISNAIKFTPTQGRVSVFLDLLKGETNNTLHLVVEDSGVGLDEETITQILQQTATSTKGTSGEQGFGLGLPLVANLVQELEGTLQIHSQPGAGTTFEIYLPQD